MSLLLALFAAVAAVAAAAAAAEAEGDSAPTRIGDRSEPAKVVGNKRRVPDEELDSWPVREAAREVMLEVERSAAREEMPNLLALQHVLSASKQVVAGVRWDLVVARAPTTCPRSSELDAAFEERDERGDKCKPHGGFARVYEATAVHRAWVVERPWSIRVLRYRQVGKDDWVPWERTAPVLSEEELARRLEESEDARREQTAADERRAAIAEKLARHKDANPGEYEEPVV